MIKLVMEELDYILEWLITLSIVDILMGQSSIQLHTTAKSNGWTGLHAACVKN